jgi:hypothetical protein
MLPGYLKAVIVLAVACMASAVFAQKSPPDWTKGDGPRVIRFPHEATAWSAAADSKQQVHVACAAGNGGKGRLWYLRSDTTHEKWPVSVEVPEGDEPVTLGGTERGPRIEVTADGGVVIAWQSKDRIAVRRSADGGKTWQAVAVRDSDATGGIDMLAMTYSDGPAPAGEQLALLWNDSRGKGRYTDDFSTGLYMAVSHDGGKTFGKNVWLNEGKPGACPCCLPSAQFDFGDRLWAAYRSSDKDVKEITVLRADPSVGRGGDVKKGVTAKTISHDGWHMVGCPMNGPTIAVQWDGSNAAVLWTKEQDARCSIMSEGGTAWSEPRSLGRGPRHAAVGAAGDMWMVWGDEKGAKLARGNGMSHVEDVSGSVNGTAVLTTLYQQPAFVVPEAMRPREGTRLPKPR